MSNPGMTRMACQRHVDRARTDCALIGKPSVLEIADRDWRELIDGAA